MTRKHQAIAMLVALICMALPTACTAREAGTRTVPNNVVILGDSNIWLAGDSCNNHMGWVAWFNDLLQPDSFVSYARSGASWSNTTTTKANPDEYTEVLGDDNVIYNQALRLKRACADGSQPAPSVIFVSAGGNDAWFAHRRDSSLFDPVDRAFVLADEDLMSMPPSRVLSLAGAVRYNCLLLRRAFPDARIVLSTPTPMSRVEPEVLTRVSDIIEATGQRMGIPTIRLDQDGPIDRDVELRQHVNTYDGIHTNETGAQRVAQYVYERFTDTK